MNKTDLLSLDRQELTEFVRAKGQGAFRAKQLYKWLISGASFDGMSDLPRAFREELERSALANPVRIEQVYVSKLDETAKFLYLLPDGNMIEGVLMRYHHGDTLCLSTQVGCNMGCKFCASTLDGCARSLTHSEMLGQVIAANGYAKSVDETRHVGNIVLMGSGEPLDNYDNVVRFLREVNSPEGLNISLRSISLSTCGLVDKMRDFAREDLPVTLSVSLHAPNDEIRATMMPIARRWKMDQLLEACAYYISKTGRRVIFEYALVEGVNCRMEHADELAARLRGMQCHVNLIPLNQVKERGLFAPNRDTARAFLNRLEKNHISATIRREMGADLEGACGQLRRRVLEQKEAQGEA